MQPNDEPKRARIVSLPSLTAWLSLCILAAAWGRTLDERWQPTWAYMGAYGLAASVGLAVLEKARQARQRRERLRQLKDTAELGLARLSEQGAALDSINTAIRQLHQFVAARDHARSPAMARAASMLPSHSLRGLSVAITPVVEQDETRCDMAEAIDGLLREISLSGVTFCHQQPFLGHVVVLTFDLADRRPISFVVDVLWTDRATEGFLTSGTLLAVGTPAVADAPADALLSTAPGSRSQDPTEWREPSGCST